jgi:hypothetical protein
MLMQVSDSNVHRKPACPCASSASAGRVAENAKYREEMQRKKIRELRGPLRLRASAVKKCGRIGNGPQFENYLSCQLLTAFI